MYNLKTLVGGAALVLATSALAGGPEIAPAPAPDNSGFYVNANGGLAVLSDANPYSNTGWDAGLAVGYRFNAIRAEIAGSYIQQDVRSRFRSLPLALGFQAGWGDLQMATLMGNAYYDFDFGSSFVPYIGAGLGWLHSWSKFTISNPTIANSTIRINGNDNEFAFQGIVGLDYKITDNVRVGVSYHALAWTHSRLVGSTDARISGTLTNRNSFENLINLGLSYYF